MAAGNENVGETEKSGTIYFALCFHRVRAELGGAQQL
jgi:hypothetical protein